MTKQRPRPTPSESQPGGEDPWVEAVRRALVPLDAPPGPVPEEQRTQAARAAERAAKELGTGIDPAPVLVGLERFAAVVRTDPTCIEGYLGIGRAVQLLAPKRPKISDELYTLVIDWLQRATSRIGPVQSAPPIHALDAKLRELRAAVRSRPRASEEDVDVVRLERDREGRAKLLKEAPRFRPPSEVLRALIGQDPTADADGPSVARVQVTRAVIIALALGLVLAAVAAMAMRDDDGRGTSWSDPALAARVQEGVAVARALLAFDAALVAEPPGPTVVVADATAGPAFRDPLHASLPAGVAATGSDLRSIVVVRRYDGPAGNLLCLWVVDLDAPAHVVARTILSGRSASAVETQASAWLASLAWRKD